MNKIGFLFQNECSGVLNLKTKLAALERHDAHEPARRPLTPGRSDGERLQRDEKKRCVRIRSCRGEVLCYIDKHTHIMRAAMMTSDLMDDDADAMTVVVDQFHSAVGIHAESVTINL